MLIPLFVLIQKVEQKSQGKSKCSAAFAGLAHKLLNFSPGQALWLVALS